MVSVIVITYNQEKYIEQCLDSILKQELVEEIEILVGDDASKDSTRKIILEYSRIHPQIVKPILRNQNIGATHNILDLLKMAKGEYIAFCEGDDYWADEHKLSKQIEYLTYHPLSKGVVHNVIVVDKNGNELDKQKIHWLQQKGDSSIDNFTGSLLPGHISSLMFRKDIIEKTKDFDNLFCDRNASDKMIFLLVLSEGMIGRINGNLSAYRFMRDSISHNLLAKMRAEKKSFCLQDMFMLNNMDIWLSKNYGRKQHFVPAQSRILVTALFHQLKGYDVTFYEVWKMCSHKYLALARFPIAFVEQLFQKIKVVFGFELR